MVLLPATRASTPAWVRGPLARLRATRFGAQARIRTPRFGAQARIRTPRFGAQARIRTPRFGAQARRPGSPPSGFELQSGVFHPGRGVKVVGQWRGTRA